VPGGAWDGRSGDDAGNDAGDDAGGPRVVLGVAGGIAAYKSVELLRRLTESGHRVRVVPTQGALEFVGLATWEALSGAPVRTDVWSGAAEVQHVRLGREAELVVVAPATADLLARLAHGRADDLLTATLLTARCPVLIAPAMHTEMWEHPATVANTAVLRERGVTVMDPAAGRLTGADSGPGRLPEAAEIAAAALACLGRGAAGVPRDLVGRTVGVTAGGTREPMDPVRFLGNRSSGRQGVALAAAARLRGATVHLVAAHVAVLSERGDPAGVHVQRVGSARELAAAVLGLAADADAVVMAAAVADFRPAEVATFKIKKGEGEPTSVPLVRNPDVLAGLGSRRRRPGQVLVGFAAETDDLLAHGRAKLAAKGADLLVVNRVGAEETTGTGFETEHNAAILLRRDGSVVDVARTTKSLLAHAIWDTVGPLLPPG